MSLISRGALQFDTSSSKYFLSEADNSVAQKLADILAGNTAFAKSGSMPAGSMTFADYASAMVSRVASEVSTVQNQAGYNDTLMQSLEYTSAELSGVDMDEEFALLIIYERSYVASSKIIATAEEMLDTLMNMV
ncbi:hypothetical protein FACS1894186_8500 [Alphaproteobacteria bacterium]|nr:hypothetical protein FACS1894186_8500 [Alphaproteobacteria bacterium]